MPALAAELLVQRLRPSDPRWPSADAWETLNRAVGGRLTKVETPLSLCGGPSDAQACTDLFKELKNPYFIRDQVGVTQTLGWVDGWTFKPSAYAVAARQTSDVVAAVNFARDNNLRLVVKGGGHSYLGTSNAPDSLMIWTRFMDDITLHDDFVAQGMQRCAATGRHGRRRRDLDAHLQRGDDQGRPLRAGRWLRHGRRRRPCSGRRLRQLLEELRHRRGEPVGGRDRDRRRQLYGSPMPLKMPICSGP